MNYKKDPQKGPPPGWRVENFLYQRLLTTAKRTQSQSLIAQVELLHDAARTDLSKVVDIVARAAKGDIDPESLNLQQIIDHGGDLSYMAVRGEGFKVLGDRERIRGSKLLPVSPLPSLVDDPQGMD